MFRILFIICVTLLSMTQSVMADEGKDKKDNAFAQYSVNLGMSLFGPTGNFGYNVSRQTSYVFAMGMFSGNAPVEPEIDGTTYTMSGGASWMGVFLNHRPAKKAKWFRLVAGLGIGYIENELKSGANKYMVRYSENPAAYLGIGFGQTVKKGFLWGLDMGLLQTGGAVVEADPQNQGPNQTESIRDYWMFGSLLFNVQFTLGWGF